MSRKLTDARNALLKLYSLEAEKIAIVETPNGIWTPYQTGIGVHPDQAGNMVITSEPAFDVRKHIFPHQELFADLQLIRSSHWRSIEIREAALILARHVRAHNEKHADFQVQLAGIDCLNAVTSNFARLTQIPSEYRNEVFLYPATSFIDRYGYLKMPCSDMRNALSCPTLHNPMRENFSFLLISSHSVKTV